MDVFQAVAQPKRRILLDALVEGPRTAGQLVDLLGEAQPAVSKHLRVLRDVGLATSRAAGPVRVYSIDLEGFRTLDAWLERYRIHWEATLDRLEHFLSGPEHRP